ncbi:uncharacterized protein LOC106669282 isoform X2 [Cimex lectularius]|nr:uncharacterized protein LOC106669282 isoform X2 [Cimex lectularius]
MMDMQCRKEYSITCLKLDLAALVPGLSVARKYKLLPGLTLEFGGFETKEPGGKLPLEAAEPVLDRYLIKGLDAFMNSIAIRVNVMDKAVAERVNNIGHTFVSGVEKYEDDFGRGRKKKINHALLMGGMISAGTLLALTMSTISAMAGKAILVSLLSLALTMMTNKANGGDSGAAAGSNAKTTYEIITHTMPHDEYTNRHWAQGFTDGYIVKATPHS